MRVNKKIVYDDATFALAVKLIEEGRLTLSEIVKRLHTSSQVFIRNMNWYFCIKKRRGQKGETDWRKIHRTKLRISKKKRDVRIVFECQACSNESVMAARPCPKCGSYCIRKQELRNKISSAEIRSEKMAGRRFMKPKVRK